MKQIRSIIPLTLLALDELADLVVSHYESFDIEGRVLIPLVKVFFPGRIETLAQSSVDSIIIINV